MKMKMKMKTKMKMEMKMKTLIDHLDGDIPSSIPCGTNGICYGHLNTAIIPPYWIPGWMRNTCMCMGILVKGLNMFWEIIKMFILQAYS